MSSWILSTYAWNPLDTDWTSAIPIIPIDPANATNTVLPFLVNKLFKLNLNAVQKDIDVLPIFASSTFSTVSCSGIGFESSVIVPSKILIILLE